MPSTSSANQDPLRTVAREGHFLSRAVALEKGLALACLLIFAVGAWGPSVDQPDQYHAFADQRHLLGIPNMLDVLSNLGFAAFGAMGLWYGHRIPDAILNRRQRNLASLFFFGLVVTALLSGWYHLHPDDAGLAIDRYGMTIAFAGLLGVAVSTRISDRAGEWLTLAALAGGAWSIATWSATDNVLPWAAVQFGGMALMLCLGCMPQRAGTLPVSWTLVILIYALAKWFEHADILVYQLSNHWISGHTLKHLTASGAALPVIAALVRHSRTLESRACDAQAGTRLLLLDSPLT